MTRYLIVHGSDRRIIATTERHPFAIAIARALSKEDPATADYEVWNENTDHLDRAATHVASYREGMRAA